VPTCLTTHIFFSDQFYRREILSSHCCSHIWDVNTYSLISIVAYRSVAKQWLGKQRSLLGNARNNRTNGLYTPFLNNESVNTPKTMGVLLGNVFYVRFMQSGYEVEFTWESVESYVEARSTLWVVGGDEKGSLEFETVKYVCESHRIRTREWLPWRGPAATVNDRLVLSSQRAPHINKPASVRH
jgi:hypothetical protein